MDNNATAILAQWLSSHQDTIEQLGSEIEQRGVLNGKSNISVISPNHLVDITAWDNSYCLDIFAFHRDSKILQYSEVGACDNETNFRNRLERFLRWFLNQL